jgi:plasmid stabilization system protein ParE
MEPTKAQLLLREHETSRAKIKNLVDFTAEEGEEIAVRVRQQVRDELRTLRALTCD